MSTSREFRQVDVFSAEPLRGNALAVVHDADGVTDAQMAAFAQWTNLSETTFLLTPTDPAADYRVRIWTPGGELPFAGHPTLGSCHAWLEAGGVPASAGVVVQECGAGLVTVRRETGTDNETEPGSGSGPASGGTVGPLAFEAPPLVRAGEVSAADRAAIATALRVEESELVDTAWIDNGPGWVGVLLRDADAVLALDPDWAAFGDLKIGVAGPHPAGTATALEVRAFCPGYGFPEDPVTGSLNAGLGQWLAGDRLPSSYLAAQGTVLGRAGRVRVSSVDGAVWVGGDTRTTITGRVRLD